jgi:hypothetical protein
MTDIRERRKKLELEISQAKGILKQNISQGNLVDLRLFNKSNQSASIFSAVSLNDTFKTISILSNLIPTNNNKNLPKLIHYVFMAKRWYQAFNKAYQR